MQVYNGVIEKNKSIKGNYWTYQKPSIKFVEKIKSSFNLSNIIASIVANRNVNDKHLNSFLNPTLKNNLPDPSSLENMDSSIKILLGKISRNKTLERFGI